MWNINNWNINLDRTQSSIEEKSKFDRTSSQKQELSKTFIQRNIWKFSNVECEVSLEKEMRNWMFVCECRFNRTTSILFESQYDFRIVDDDIEMMFRNQETFEFRWCQLQMKSSTRIRWQSIVSSKVFSRRLFLSCSLWWSKVLI